MSRPPLLTFLLAETLYRACFQNQPGRRFIYAFSVSLTAFQLFFFDRSGAVHTEKLDIHQDALTFVRVVRFLIKPDLDTLGFDPKFYWDGNQRQIKVFSGGKVTKYHLEDIVSQDYTMHSKNTICWVGRRAGKGKQFLIKDKWNEEEWSEEADMLIVARDARVPGVSQLVAIDETFPATKPMSTSLLRQQHKILIPEARNLVFSRTVLELHGSPICCFESGLQLLQAFRDSIHGASFILLFCVAR